MQINSKNIRELAIKSKNSLLIKPIFSESLEEVTRVSKTIEVMETITEVQALTDYYRYIKYQDTLEGTDDIEFYPIIEETGNILNVFYLDNLADEIYDSLGDYDDASAYDKVLLEKCLDEKDVERLEKLNPFYKEEREKYNIDIDLNFITRQIDKWQKAFAKNPHLSYEQSTDFLINLSKIDQKLSLKLINEMLDELNSNIFIRNTVPSEECINVNGMMIDEEVLSEIIKDYYNQEKSKKYVYGDKHDK